MQSVQACRTMASNSETACRPASTTAFSEAAERATADCPRARIAARSRVMVRREMFINWPTSCSVSLRTTRKCQTRS